MCKRDTCLFVSILSVSIPECMLDTRYIISFKKILEQLIGRRRELQKYYIFHMNSSGVFCEVCFSNISASWPVISNRYDLE